jgi:predicted metal-dependent phosphoesterase TrpH
MIDLHLHSTASDGHHNPSELMRMTKKLGISTVALTDHDTMYGVEEAREEAKAQGLRFIQGVEISAGGCPETHILGYGLDKNSPRLRELFEQMRQARRKRAMTFVKKLNDIGIPISYERVLDGASDEMAIGRPHIGNALVEMGYAQDLSDAFGKYLIRSAKTYVQREKVPIKQAIETINKARGVAVLAHPALLRYDSRTLENAVIYMKAIGISGIECYHPTHSREDVRFYRSLAGRMGLLITGGSDFHGGVPNASRPAPCPGDGVAEFFDADERADMLIAEIKARNLA